MTTKKRSRRQRFAKLPIALQVLSALLALEAIARVAWLIAHRVSYPFELEWTEGEALQQVQRVLAGQALYVAPTVDFVPLGYTPLYYYLAAALSLGFRAHSFLPLRLLSVASTVGCGLAIFWLVRQQTKSLWASALATGLFAACFRVGGAWFDIARPDMLFLALALWIAAWVRTGPSTRWQAIGIGLLGALAFYTKQTSLPLCAVMLGYWALSAWPLALTAAGTLAAAVVIPGWLANRASDGWYAFYTSTLPRLRWRHFFTPQKLRDFAIHDLAATLPIALAAALIAIALRRQAKGSERGFLAIFLGAFVGVAALARAELGGYENALLPAYAALAIGFGIGAQQALTEILQWRTREAWRYAALAVMVALIGWQFQALRFPVAAQIPTEHDRQVGYQFVGALSREHGDVLVTHAGYLGVLASKPWTAHALAVGDILLTPGTRGTPELIESFRRAFEAHRFPRVYTSVWPGALVELLARNYRTKGPAIPDTGFIPVTGAGVRPDDLWVPR